MAADQSSALITGVSTGIGYGALKELIKRGWFVFGTVRKPEDAEKLQAEFGSSFLPLIADVTNQEEINKSFKVVQEKLKGGGLSLLINNAGIAIAGALQHQSMEDIEYQFEVNVFGLMRVTKTFLPLLGADKSSNLRPGRIINISSVGGKVASPFVGAYVGTKHAVEGISASLRRELLMYGIDVIIVGPGVVKTPIWDKGVAAQEVEQNDYERPLKRFAKVALKSTKNGLDIEYVGRKLADIAGAKQPKTRYALVPQHFSNWTIPRLLSDRMLDKAWKKILGV